jgi:hypothetical protein
MTQIPYRNTPPEFRTVVNGIWSDILNDWQASFETSNRGNTALGVFIQDQTTPVLTVPLLQGRAILTLAVDTVIDSNVINVDAGHGVVVGEVIEIADVVLRKFMQSQAVGTTATTITLDQPINRVYTIADSVVQASIQDMLVNGSVTPQVFSVLPLPSQSGDMVRIILELRGDSNASMDFTTFGSEPALVNGCVLRIKGVDGNFINLFNFKSNSDFIEQGFDHSFLEPKGGNTQSGFVARVTWGGQSKHGVVIRLDGSLGEELQIVIQDDLTTGNTRFHLTAQGHELQSEGES